MDEGKPGLIADGVEAPELGHVDVVLGREATGHLDASGGHVKVERGLGTSQVSPLGHRFEMIDRLSGFNLDRSHDLSSLIRGRQDQVGIDLNGADLHRDALVGPDVRDDFVALFQSDLEQANDAIVFQLLAHRPYENRAQEASLREKVENIVGKSKETRNSSAFALKVYTVRRGRAGLLDAFPLTNQNVSVISATVRLLAAR